MRFVWVFLGKRNFFVRSKSWCPTTPSRRATGASRWCSAPTWSSPVSCSDRWSGPWAGSPDVSANTTNRNSCRSRRNRDSSSSGSFWSGVTGDTWPPSRDTIVPWTVKEVRDSAWPNSSQFWSLKIPQIDTFLLHKIPRSANREWGFYGKRSIRWFLWVFCYTSIVFLIYWECLLQKKTEAGLPLHADTFLTTFTRKKMYSALASIMGWHFESRKNAAEKINVSFLSASLVNRFPITQH